MTDMRQAHKSDHKKGGAKRGTKGVSCPLTQVPMVLVRSVLLIALVFYVVFLCFVCRRPVSCVPNVASVSGLSILDCPFGFL